MVIFFVPSHYPWSEFLPTHFPQLTKFFQTTGHGLYSHPNHRWGKIKKKMWRNNFRAVLSIFYVFKYVCMYIKALYFNQTPSFPLNFPKFGQNMELIWRVVMWATREWLEGWGKIEFHGKYIPMPGTKTYEKNES